MANSKYYFVGLAAAALMACAKPNSVSNGESSPQSTTEEQALATEQLNRHPKKGAFVVEFERLRSVDAIRVNYMLAPCPASIIEGYECPRPIDGSFALITGTGHLRSAFSPVKLIDVLVTYRLPIKLGSECLQEAQKALSLGARFQISGHGSLSPIMDGGPTITNPTMPGAPVNGGDLERVLANDAAISPLPPEYIGPPVFRAPSVGVTLSDITDCGFALADPLPVPSPMPPVEKVPM